MAPAYAALPLLRRAGWVLIALGALDIAVLLACLWAGVPYASSLNVFAVIAGVLLLRGNLQAAGAIRAACIFTLAMLALLPLVLPALLPFGLMAALARTAPLAATLAAAVLLGTVVLSAWLIVQLGTPPVRAARAAAGLRPLKHRLSIALGVAGALALGGLGLMVRHSAASEMAVHLAKQQWGDAYHYQVLLLDVHQRPAGMEISATVAAWQDGELRYVPVRWGL